MWRRRRALTLSRTTSAASECMQCGHRSPISGRNTPTTPTSVARTSPRRCSTRVRLGPGERVLELACGPGGVGLAAAAARRCVGEVVISDVVPAMVAIAAARAERWGLDERPHVRSRPRSDRRSRRAFRRRAVSRRADVRHRSVASVRRDPSRPVRRRSHVDRRVGSPPGEPMARHRPRRGCSRHRTPRSAARNAGTVCPRRSVPPRDDPRQRRFCRHHHRARSYTAALAVVRGVVDAHDSPRRAGRLDHRSTRSATPRRTSRPTPRCRGPVHDGCRRRATRADAPRHGAPSLN